MAARANFDLKNACIKRFSVKNSVVITVGARVKFGASDTEVDLSAANDDGAFGTAYEAGTGNAAGSVLIDVILDGHIIVPMVVGTGGSTRGAKQVCVGALGAVTDLPVNGGGTTPHTCVGIAMQSGVVGDLIGVMPTNHRNVAAT